MHLQIEIQYISGRAMAPIDESRSVVRPRVECNGIVERGDADPRLPGLLYEVVLDCHRQIQDGVPVE
jgi:hypothetical protein